MQFPLVVVALTALTGVSSALHAPLLARGPRPQLSQTTSRRVAVGASMQDEFPTLEEELANGSITQEEYNEMSGGISEEEYEAEQQQSQPLSAGAQTVVNNMKSDSGVEFAPWMKIDAEAIARAKKEREERKKRSASNLRSDAMLIDPQAAELGAGGGLKSKVLSEEEVELRWDTTDEAGNAGFIIQRRRGGESVFDDIASYDDFSPLRSKGPAGGSYVYLDDTADVGTWVYRILDCDTKGAKSAVCQKLVEIDSKSEQTQTLIVGGVIASLALVLVVLGILNDPIQTTQNGAKIF
jgi:hypothetical protein